MSQNQSGSWVIVAIAAILKFLDAVHAQNGVGGAVVQEIKDLIKTVEGGDDLHGRATALIEQSAAAGSAPGAEQPAQSGGNPEPA